MSEKQRIAELGLFALLILLCIAWIMPGLIGHEPWKPDEAYSFGLVNHIIQSGDWVVPTLAGEPFMEKPPLYYLTAAACARLFSPWLTLHDGARLASGFFMALTLLFTGFAGRELFGKGAGRLAVLVLIGSLGLLIHAHELITDVALLTGFAIALYGLALSLRRSIAGGIALGTGIGIAFMSKGLIGPGIIGVTALALPLAFRTWRNRNYAHCLLAACGALLPWLVVWPYALYQRSPQLFMEWFWINNVGRFFGFSGLGPGSARGDYLMILPWFTWPALPLALWTAWRERRALLKKPQLQLPLTAFLVTLAVLSIASDARDVYALPLLLPLAYLATAAIGTLRRGAANALYWFGVMTFVFFAGVIWFYWVAVEFGVPAQLSEHLMQLQPGYTPVFNGMVFFMGLLYSLGWIAILVLLKHSKARPVIVWASGMTLMWGLVMTLFISWLDAGKSYRSMITSMQHALPAHYQCIASQSLGEPQRALLEYYANIHTQRLEISDAANCDVLLIQGGADEVVEPGQEWRKIWEGNRPGDKKERYRLFRSVTPDLKKHRYGKR